MLGLPARSSAGWAAVLAAHVQGGSGGQAQFCYVKASAPDVRHPRAQPGPVSVPSITSARFA